MSTLAKPGIGAILNRWSTAGTSGAWVEIIEVTALSWSGIVRNVIQTFKLNNADDYVNKLQGTIDGGNLTATVNYTRNQFQDLKTEAEIRGVNQYQLVFPDGEALEFDGFITELPIDPINADDVMQGDLLIEIDGKPDIVSAASP